MKIQFIRNYLTDDWKWISTNLRKGREESALLSLRPLAPSEAQIIFAENSAQGTVLRPIRPFKFHSCSKALRAIVRPSTSNHRKAGSC
jgi:hypothetical protein